MVIIIDNYDSFIYNLYQQVLELGVEVSVYRNDSIDCHRLEELKPSHIIISPGPCSPDQAGISVEVIGYFAGRVPILGVCLGHQAIGQAFGGRVVRAVQVMHGLESAIYHDQKTIYKGMSIPFMAGRYHSLCVEGDSLPPELEVSAWTAEGEIMGFRHERYTVEGVQFHPESILTPEGINLIKNFLKITGGMRHGADSLN
ncbi:anthranilate synthase component II [Desulforamulus aquiferis]|uniref:Aminodeoxychorismate/anthranilate synthase component II n=1 Tax=Desulforamulus aquiferis TaxID=1397668 RepID=A0AAW7ZB79_9FIRM|nr:aminodeoxychorismate/anthranilate synthase component II [Desulforamulus aquiferis]MDO7786934.1 aminodeoxychorismate/anthranilate synthase component II [Desulforamulus aquiferis]RYD03944.1 hypothetical protein N752_17835 [Desulforamulus aquiferis]